MTSWCLLVKNKTKQSKENPKSPNKQTKPQHNKLLLPYQHPSTNIMEACEKVETGEICGWDFLKKTLNIILKPLYSLFSHLAIKQFAVHMLVAVVVKICKDDILT